MLSAGRKNSLCSAGVFLLSCLCLCRLWPPPRQFPLLKQTACTSATPNYPVKREPASASTVCVWDECRGFPPLGAVACPGKQSPCHRGPNVEPGRSFPASWGPQTGWECTSPEGKVRVGGVSVEAALTLQVSSKINTKISDKFLACFAGSLRPVLKFHHLIFPLLKFQQNIKFSLISCSKFSTLNWQLIQLLGLH